MSAPEVTLNDTFQILVESSNCNDYDDNISVESYDSVENKVTTVEERQGALCERLFSQLQEFQQQKPKERRRGGRNLDTNSNAKDAIKSIRLLFPKTKVSDLLPSVLNPLLNDRVDTQRLLPGTQDEAANEEILLESTKSAFSLTLPAMQAGLLYAHLLNRPGALGSGLVDLEPLTALVALIRRWMVECCGREQYALSSCSESSFTSTNASPHSSSKSPPQKRSRRGSRSVRVMTTLSNDHEDQDTEERQTCDILAMGSLVAMEVCKIPQQAEFASWSSESRDVLLQAVLVAMGTAAALFAGKRGTGDSNIDKSHDSGKNTSPEKMILHHCQMAFEECLVVADSGEEENDDPHRQQQRHETAVIILRGLMHFLQLKVTLPNGERGKLEAYSVTSNILLSLMQKVDPSIMSRKAHLSSVSVAKTPNASKKRRSSIGKGLSSRSLGLSSRSLKGDLDGSLTPMKSPVLKRNFSNESRSAHFDSIASASKTNGKTRGVPAIFLGLLQKLTTGRVGLEKAALRKSTVQTIQSCMRWLPHLERSHFLEYVLKICHSKVSVHRLVACELLGHILSQEWMVQHENDKISEDDYEDRSFYDTPGGNDGEGKNEANRLPQVLWHALQGRLIDRIAAVRASAATSLETIMTEIQMGSKESCQNSNLLFTNDTENLLMALRKRAIKDETATVRKAAVLALTKVLLVKKDNISAYYISAICELCQDSSLLTRRAAAEALTTLLEACTRNAKPTNTSALDEDLYDVGMIEEAWSTCVLPMVLDEETSMKARYAFYKVVVLPIVESGDTDDEHKQQVAWRILANVGNLTGQQGASKGATQALQKALLQLGREYPDVINIDLFEQAAAIAARTLTQYDISEVTTVGVWCLLEAMLTNDSNGTTKNLQFENIDLSFCESAWQKMLQKHQSTPKSLPRRSTLKSSLIVLSKVAKAIVFTDSEDTLLKMNECLLGFHFPPDAVGPAICAMTELTKHVNAGKRNNSETWIRGIFSECEKEITSFVQEANTDSSITSKRQPKLLRALFSVGEASMIGFKLDDDEKTSPTPAYLKPSKRLQDLLQILVSGHLPGDSRTKIPPATRAHAFTVLGKFCLRDESLARRSLTLLARELHPSLPNPNQSVQSNALLVLGDLCVRYTNMTDRYLPVMASCLQNGTTENISILERSSVVRKHAVLLLSSLLLQDYIKWRGLLFHRFLVACSDDDEEVAMLAESVLSGPLMVRNPKIFFNHFVEAIFVLNKCVAHPIYVSATRQGDGGSGIAVSFDGINLDGNEGETRRRNIYAFLLSKLTDEEKIGVTARLAKEVLGEAVGNEGDLSHVCKGLSPPNDSSSQRLKSAWSVLADTFFVLTNKAIKVGRIQEDLDGNIEDPNQLANPSRQVTVAKTRLLSKISLKHMVEIVLPILCNLKIKLQASRSPILKDLMEYMLEIYRNHKVEVKEFLANDPTLLQEIEYDARKHSSNSEM
jgi:condensin-2 complex subunit D3